jgi:hypothetical protein
LWRLRETGLSLPESNALFKRVALLLRFKTDEIARAREEGAALW